MLRNNLHIISYYDETIQKWKHLLFAYTIEEGYDNGEWATTAIAAESGEWVEWATTESAAEARRERT